MRFKSKHLGSSLESLLQEDGRLQEATVAAIKSVIAWQLAEEMRKKKDHQEAHGRNDANQPRPTRQCSQYRKRQYDTGNLQRAAKIVGGN